MPTASQPPYTQKAQYTQMKLEVLSQYIKKVKCKDYGIRQTQVQILVLLFMSLSKLINLFTSVFSTVKQEYYYLLFHKVL